MVALQPVPGVVRLVHSGLIGAARSWANIFHVGLFVITSGDRAEAAWLQSEVDSLVAGARAAWVTHWRPVLGAFVSLTSTMAVDLTDDTGVTGVDLLNSAGSLAGSAPAASTAQCISWRENLHYRGGHPRTYLPPPTVSQLFNAFTWTAAHATALETAANGYRTAIEAINLSASTEPKLVTVHRIRDKGTLNNPVVTTITGELVDARIDSQRRRLGPDL